MNRSIALDAEVLVKLKFIYDGEVWIHHQEKRYSIKLELTAFVLPFLDT